MMYELFPNTHYKILEEVTEAEELSLKPNAEEFVNKATDEQIAEFIRCGGFINPYSRKLTLIV
jgi:endonuclease III-like uncharacterized protein